MTPTHANVALLPHVHQTHQFIQMFQDEDNIEGVSLFEVHDLDNGRPYGSVGIKVPAEPEEGFDHAVWGWITMRPSGQIVESQDPYHTMEDALTALLNESEEL